MVTYCDKNPPKNNVYRQVKGLADYVKFYFVTFEKSY